MGCGNQTVASSRGPLEIGSNNLRISVTRGIMRHLQYWPVCRALLGITDVPIDTKSYGVGEQGTCVSRSLLRTEALDKSWGL